MCKLVNQPSTLRNFRKQTPRPLVKDTDSSRTLGTTFLTPKDNGALQINHLFVPGNNDNNNTQDDEETPVSPGRTVTAAWVLKAVKLARAVPNIQSCTFEIGDAILYTDKYTEDDNNTIAVQAGFTKSQELAEATFAATKQRAYNKIVPKAYRNYNNVFSKASKRKPKFGPFDHAIDLKPGFKPKPCKLYPLLLSEQVALDEWLEEHLKKGYIWPSKSPMASPFFFVKKKDGSLRPIQDYQYLNSGTIKNAYPLPLIGELIDQLKGLCIFSKFDIRWGYPNVRIKEGDEWKPVFCTNRGLFEPLVMFFGLTNSPATFQSMMNKIFEKLIAKGHVVVYMDDILVFTNDLKHHRQVAREVLEILRQNDLYLKAVKCAFKQTKIEFLGMVIEHNSLSMDPIKVDRILSWPRPKNITDVQALAGFTGFYQCFINGYAKLFAPLYKLTKKDVPWQWHDEQKEVFQCIKRAFTTAPVLLMPDVDKLFRIECDASDFATGAVLEQKGDDDLWHPTAYISKAMDPAECNYDIYDKELLTVFRLFKAWRHYLKGANTRWTYSATTKTLSTLPKPRRLTEGKQDGPRSSLDLTSRSFTKLDLATTWTPSLVGPTTVQTSSRTTHQKSSSLPDPSTSLQ
jgi:hypothetical protein